MSEKLQELGWEGKSSDEVNPDKNAPDFGFYVADMTGKQWLNTIGDLGTSVWENATLPENYWKEDEAGHKNSTIKTPALFAGVSDGGIDLVSDYPQLVKLGYDVATKTQFRQQLWDGIKNIDADKIINEMMKRGIEGNTLDNLRHSGIDINKWLHGFDDVTESLQKSVSIVKNHPLMPKNIPVHGLIIDPTTGKLDLIVNGWNEIEVEPKNLKENN